jgi:hypothetical protein
MQVRRVEREKSGRPGKKRQMKKEAEHRGPYRRILEKDREEPTTSKVVNPCQIARRKRRVGSSLKEIPVSTVL